MFRKFQTLNCPNEASILDQRGSSHGSCRGRSDRSAAANRQTEMMYMLGRHILARNFFLKPDYLRYVPDHVRDYHQSDSRRLTKR